ncbi:MAG: epoxide hydrolase 1 [Acidimicrobiia bacterium]|nr:epoxide hydrolase 1 [Acidimicrobiia bacterium]
MAARFREVCVRRRDVLRSAVAIAAAPLSSIRPAAFMAGPQDRPGPAQPGLRPFRLDVPGAAIQDLHRRIDATRWPEMPFDTGWTQGTNDGVLRDLVRYWRHGYDWEAVQAGLNRLTHLRGPVGGEALHCVTYAGAGERKPFPLLLMSGWPGSFLEFIHAAPRLAQAGWDLVVPSLPGYGFSDVPREPGMNTRSMAGRMHALMQALGHERYGIHGSDWGALVGTIQAAEHGESVVGLHLTLASAAPAALRTSEPAKPDPVRPDQRERDNGWRAGNTLQSASPQTLGYALEDSPVGCLSWILMRYWSQSDHDADADLWQVFSRDDVLTTAMLYWLPGRMLSSMRLYWETFTNAAPAPFRRVTVPTAYARFQGAVPLGATREAMAPAYNLVRYTEPPRGGHFAALEQPEAFATDVAGFFATLA